MIYIIGFQYERLVRSIKAVAHDISWHLPADATDQTVYYASSNEKVASVNSMGRIRANEVGIAIGDVIIYCSAGGLDFHEDKKEQ